jgi:hypothetical protein
VKNEIVVKFLLSINKLRNEENIHSTFNLKENLQILKYDVKMMLK